MTILVGVSIFYGSLCGQSLIPLGYINRVCTSWVPMYLQKPSRFTAPALAASPRKEILSKGE